MMPVDTIDEPLAQIAEEFTQRCRRGDTVSVEQYALRHPEYAERIRNLFPTLLSLEQASLSADGMERIGEFRILGEIGRGGMGVVYEAVQESLNRHVALKILPPELARNEAAVERFHREARAAAQLHHGNIVPVFGVGEARWYALGTTVHYYAMQFIDGIGLDQLLDQVRRKRNVSTAPIALHTTEVSTKESSSRWNGHESVTFKVPQRSDLLATQSHQAYYQTIVRWGIQAAEALAHAHERGLLHRDVKPSNFLIDERSQLWLTDFGLAKAATDAEMTRTGDVIGTLRYLAPERLNGQASPQSDQFSLAATLYECLTLQPVFGAIEKAQLLEQIHRGQVIPLRQHDPSLPLDLELILSTALEGNPAERYGSVQLLADDLRRFQNGEPIHARKANRWYRARKFISRHRQLVSATVAIVLLLILGIAGTTWGLLDSNRSRLKAEHAQRQTAAAQLQTMKALQSATSVGVEKLIGSKTTLGAHEKAYLESTLNLWKTFANETGDNEQSRRMRAQGELEIGGLRVHLGQFQEAEAGFLRAISLFQELIQLSPGEADYRDALAESYLRLTNLLQTTSRIPEGQARCAQAMEVQQELVHQYPEVDRYRWKLAAIHHGQGIMLYVRLQLDEAQEQFTKALGLLDPATMEKSNDPGRQRLLGTVYFSMSKLHESRGHYSRAIEDNQKAMRWKQSLANQFPDVVAYRIELAKTHHAMGINFKNIGQLNEALVEYEAAIILLRALDNEFPLVPEYRHDLASSLSVKGNILQLQKKYQDALSLYREALQLEQSLVKNYPEVAIYHRKLGLSFNNLGLVLKEQGNLPEALKAYQESLAVQESLNATVPDMQNYQNDLAQTHNNIGIVHKDAGRYDLALESYHKSMVVLEQLARMNPGVLDHQINFGGSQVNMGNLLNAMGRTTESLPWRTKSIQTLQAVVDQNPKSVKAQSFLMKAYRSRAKTLMKLNNYPEAWQDWEQVAKLVDDAEKLENRVQQAACVAHLNHVALLKKALLEDRLTKEADHWTTHHLQLALGRVQYKQQDYQEAERNLSAGYTGLKQRIAGVPSDYKNQLMLALDDLIAVCQAQKKSTENWKNEKLVLQANNSK